MAGGLDDLVDSNDVGMFHLFEDADFLKDAFDLAGLVEPLFIEYFDGNLSQRLLTFS